MNCSAQGVDSFIGQPASHQTPLSRHLASASVAGRAVSPLPSAVRDSHQRQARSAEAHGQLVPRNQPVMELLLHVLVACESLSLDEANHRPLRLSAPGQGSSVRHSLREGSRLRGHGRRYGRSVLRWRPQAALRQRRGRVPRRPARRCRRTFQPRGSRGDGRRGAHIAVRAGTESPLPRGPASRRSEGRDSHLRHTLIALERIAQRHARVSGLTLENLPSSSSSDPSPSSD